MRVGGLALAVVLGLLAAAIPLVARYAWADPLATPSVTLGLPATALIGSTVSVPVTFDNPAATAVGYGPYVVLCLPATGADGAAAAVDDGLTFAGATYLGAAVTAFPLTINGSLQATNPLTGQAITCPAGSGFRSGDQAVVLQLPFGSFTAAQPPATLSVTLNLSNLADLSTPLRVNAAAGYQFGDTPTGANGPQPAGTLTPASSATLTPALYTLTKTYLGPEDETATGGNFPRRYRIDATVAPGQTLSNLAVTDTLPPTMQFRSVTAVSPAGPAATATPSTLTPGGTLTRTFATVTGTGAGPHASVEYEFHVPESGATAPTTPVLGATTGAFRRDATTTNPAGSTGTWTPIDGRDAATPAPATAVAHVLEEQSLAVQKSVAIVADTGAAGASPGDTLEWSLSVQVSDFFTFDQLSLADTLSDGQTLVGGSATWSATEAGVARSGALTGGRFATTTVACPGAPATSPPARTGIVIDLSGAVDDDPLTIDGRLAGGLAADPMVDLGATNALVTFRTTIDQAYDCAVVSGNQTLDPGDPVTNAVTITGAVLDDLAPFPPTGSNVGDDSGAGVVIVGGALTKSVYAVNGAVLGTTAVQPIAPGDTVTYRIRSTTPVWSAENLVYTDYLPLPIFSATEITGFDAVSGAAAPAAGRAKYGPDDTFRNSGTAAPAVATDGTANSVTFSRGTKDTDGSTATVVDLLFTVTASASRYADGLFLTNQVRESQNNSFDVTATQDAIVQVQRTEPVLAVTKGVVATSNPAGDVFSLGTGPGGGVTWNPPGTSPAFTGGTVGSTGLAAAPVASDVSGLDADDLVRFAVAVDNRGTGIRGAFDVTIRDTRPLGMVDPAGGIDLTVTDGAGTALAYTTVGTGLFDAAGGIRLTDPGALTGALAADHATSGADIAVIAYTLRTPPDAAGSVVHTNTATLTSYSGSEGGPNFLAAPLSDAATATTSRPISTKTILSTSEPSTSGTNVVVGERVVYQVTLTIPEGTTSAAVVVDQLDAGLNLVSIDSLTRSGPALTTSRGSGDAGFDTVRTTAVVTSGSPQTATFDFATLTNSDSDNTTTETVVVVYTVAVANTAAVQSGSALNNRARLTSTGNTLSDGNAPNVTVREPNVTVATTVAPATMQAGQTVTYTITVTSPSGSNTVTAYDVSLTDAIPAGLTPVPGSFVRTAGTVPATLSQSGSDLAATWTSMAPGTSTTFTVAAVVDTTLAATTWTNTADVAWSSLPGDQTTSPSPTTAPLAVERTGSTLDTGGAANDYRNSASVTHLAAAGIVKALASTSSTATAGSDVTIGETATYTLTVTLPEGGLPGGFTVTEAVPAGMAYTGGATVTPGSFNGTLPAPTIGPAGAGTDGQPVTFTFGDTTTAVDGIAGNDSFTITFTAVTLDVAGNVGRVPPGRTTLADTATLTLSGGRPPVNSSPVTVTVAEPALTMTKAMTPASARVGDTVTVALTVTNTGASPAYNPVIGDPVDGAFLTSLTPTTTPAGWAAGVAGTTVSWADDPDVAGDVQIDPGGANAVTFRFTGVVAGGVANGQTFPNTATVAGATSLPGTVAGERTAATATADATLTALTPDLAVTNTDNLTRVSPGQTVTTTLRVTNNGGADAAGVVLTDTLPAGVTFVSASDGGGAAAGVVTFPALALAAGASRDFTVTVRVDLPAGVASLTDTATVADDGTRGVDPTPADNAASDTDTVSAATAALGGSVYVDLDNNGLRAGGEPGVGGVAVRLTGTDENGQAVDATLTTAADGSYAFTSLVAGTYAVTETQPPAWNDGTDRAGTAGGTTGNDTVTAVALAAATTATGYTFGEIGTGLSGSVFVDGDRDGLREAGDGPLAGVTVTLRDAGGTVVATTTSAADGTWSFPNLAAGTYTVTETQPAGYGSSNDDARPVILPTTGLAGIDFGDTLSTLSGVVYVDVDDDGARDGAEPGIGGVVVTLRDSGGATVATATTAADGGWSFAGLPAGTYTVTETQPAAWNDGLDAAGTAGGTVADDEVSALTLPAGTDSTGYRFGERGTTLTGTVFADTNRDGLRTGGDPGLVGVALTLTDADGNVLGATTTGADGGYWFADLAAGTYTVTETQPTGYDSSTPGTVTAGVPLAGLAGVDFGDTLSSLAGAVYVDRNENGTRDVGGAGDEPGIGGVTVTLAGTDAAGAPVERTTVTAGDGTWSFTALVAGTYTVTETHPGAWTDGQDSAGTAGGTVTDDAVSGVALPAGIDQTGYLFGERGTTLTGTVSVEDDRDGVRQDGEAPLAGVVVTLEDADGNVVATATTGADGTYRFDDLAAGAYTVRQAQPSGYGSSTPNVLDVAVPINGLAGVDFGETRSTLAGVVYVDRDGDGAQDGGEPGIGGVTVRLTGTDAGGDPLDRSTTTGADGTWSFDDLLAGTYTVIETQPAAWSDGPDGAGTAGGVAGGVAGDDEIAAIALPGGIDATGYRFGERGATLAGAVYIGGPDGRRPGDGSVAGVTITLWDADGILVATTTAGPDGSYTFTDLPTGSYTVEETQPPGYGSSTPDHRPVDLPLDGVTGTDFGETLSTISGSVYVDANGDGRRDDGEAPIAGVTVTLTGTDVTGTPVVSTTTSGADGTWVFTGLLAGTYSVTETHPVRYIDGGDTAGQSSGAVLGVAGDDVVTGIALPAGALHHDNLFGERPTADLAVAKTHTGGPFTVADAFDHTITITNRGPSDAAGPLILTDPLPDGEVYRAAAGDGWGCAVTGTTLTCDHAGSLPVGATTTVTLAVALAPAAPETFVNRVAVTSPTGEVANDNNTGADEVETSPATDTLPDNGWRDPGQPGGTLPKTGTDPGGWSRGGLLLLEVGAALLLLGRRRRRGQPSPPEPGRPAGDDAARASRSATHSNG